MPKNQTVWPKIALGILICQLAGVVGALWTSSAVRDWYPTLIRPTWTPPSWVFAPVWTVLYALMGIAVGLIWAKGLSSSREKRALVWFWAQLALSVAWTAVFFGARAPGWGYIVIILLWLSIAATMWIFSKISRVAALLLVPYFGWVTFASALNFHILTFNVMRPRVQKMDKDPRNHFTRPYREAPKLRRSE